MQRACSYTSVEEQNDWRT